MSDETYAVGGLTNKKRLVETPSTGIVAEMVYPALGFREYVYYPFAKGNLTTDGIQYSAATTTVTTGWTAVETATIDPPKGGTITETELGLTASVAASSAAYTITHKWQARNSTSLGGSGTWVDLMAAHSTTVGSTAFAEVTMSGRFATTTDFDTLPAELRLVVQSAATSGPTVTGRTKNSGYVRFVVEDT